MSTTDAVNEGAQAALGLATAALNPSAVDPKSVVALIDGADVDAHAGRLASPARWPSGTACPRPPCSKPST